MNDDPFEEELRLRFSMLDLPAPGAGALERSVRRFRRWRLRRRLLVATPGIAAAASLGVALGLGGVGSPGSGGSSGTNAFHLGTRNAIRLASYRFPMPRGFHATAATTPGCYASVGFLESFSAGSTPETARTVMTTAGTETYSTVEIASAASADGGCVEMALTGPFTPTKKTGNPNLEFTASTSSARRVDVAGHVGWLTTAGTDEGRQRPQVTVELPQANGRMRDLGVGASGLDADELLAIVSGGLS